MTLFICDGTAGGGANVFSWSVVYNDQGQGSVTAQATGPGRATIILQQEDLQQAAVYFIQPPGNGALSQRLPMPVGEVVVVERDVVIGSGPLVISPARLDPFPAGPKPGAVGGFRSQMSHSTT